jgi:predicted PurR-regulated permease PerM
VSEPHDSPVVAKDGVAQDGVAQDGVAQDGVAGNGAVPPDVDKLPPDPLEPELATVPPPIHPPDFTEGRVRAGALFRWGFFTVLGVALGYAAVQVVLLARNLLVLVVVAMFLAVSLDPMVRWLVARGMRRGFAVGLICFVAVSILAGFVISLVPPLTTQGTSLINHLPDYVNSLQARFGWFRRLDARYHLGSRLEGSVGEIPGRLAGGVLGLAGRVLSTLASLLALIVFTVYFMLDLPRLRAGVVRLFPVDRRERYGSMVEVVVEKVGTYMIGRVAIGAISGVIALLGLMLLHIPYPLPLAIAIGALDIIPLIGHPIGAAIAVIVAVFSVSWPTTVTLLVFFLVYQQLENYLLAPRILRHSVDLSPAAVLFAALVGAAVFGVVGAFVAIPLAAAMKVLLVREIDQHEARADVHRSLRRYRLHRHPSPK